MPDYRIYKLDKGGHIREPAELIEVPSDYEAINHANMKLDGQDLQVWQGARLVISLESKEK